MLVYHNEKEDLKNIRLRSLTFLIPPRWRLCDQVSLFVILSSLLCSLTQKVMHGYILNFYQRQVLAQSRGDFILEVIWINLHCHVQVTVAQQGHLSAQNLW